MLRYRRHIGFARVRGSPLHSCFKCHWVHHYYPATPLIHVFFMSFHHRWKYSMQMDAFPTCSGTTNEVSKLHPYFGSTAACVHTSFRVCTGFHCVICVIYDQICTPGHWLAIQALEPEREWLVITLIPMLMCLHRTVLYLCTVLCFALSLFLYACTYACVFLVCLFYTHPARVCCCA